MARRTLGSLVPHPASIGKVAGAHMGIKPMHLARGGIGNMENIEQNMFQPITPDSNIPNADVNFISSPQLSAGKGPPVAQAAKPQQQPSPMQQIAEGTGAAAGLTSLYKALPSLGSWGGVGAVGPMPEAGVLGAVHSGLDYLGTLFLAEGGSVPHRADGGDIPGVMGTTNMLMRREAGETFHPSGLLNSAGPGRTDTINTNVPTGAYVIPADVVSGLGEGNTLAGSAVIDRMFATAPHGIKAPVKVREGRGVHMPNPPSSAYANNYLEPQSVDTNFMNTVGEGKYAKGGKTDTGKAPVVVAGGEHVLSPQQIIAKFGSLKRGHRILDHWVVMMREKIAKEMLKLAPPVGSRVKKK